jgi:demethylmenaquinone methyltransferase/2-methoxy-6-polyprenyl-1,4-benzoquinol methylase
MERTENNGSGAGRNVGSEGPRTHFGFRDVESNEKSALVRGVFDSVAERYDLMNDLMSGGIHRLWKASFIDQLRPRPGMHLLDVAGGTGDISLRFREAGGERVTVCDISQSMVKVGRDRAIDLNRPDGIQWTVGDAEALPLPDGSVDAYTIAFGLRNVTQIDNALSEARRVLRPGGRFMCLEFSHVASPVLAELYDQFSFNILPLLGHVVANDEEAYRYLVESIRRFPSQEELSTRMRAAGLEQVSYRNLSRGIAAIHFGWRI